MTALAGEAQASDLLIFSIAGHRFGLPAGDIIELTLAVAMTPLPKLPSGAHVADVNAAGDSVIEGLVDYHGEIAAVINLRPRFGEAVLPLDAKEHFIFLRLDKNLIALRADRVEALSTAPVVDAELLMDLYQQTRRYPGKTVRISPALQHGSDLAGLASGVARLSNDLIYIFDLKTLLTGSESEDLAFILHQAKEKRLAEQRSEPRRADGV